MMAEIEPYAIDSGTPPVQKVQERIGFLDGFRGIAILLVLFYHYYSRYATDPRDMYPFGDLWSGFPLCKYGYYGVQLFFAVSGFVIALTLTRCKTFSEFLVRRFARLWPTMLLCACLSYSFLSNFGYWPQHPANFLPSLTFIDGMVYHKIFTGTQFNWIDGAYWSLFVEVRFYAIAAAVYFIDRKRFHAHFFIFAVVDFVVYMALGRMGQESAKTIADAVLIPTYLPWFLFGISAHCLWSGKHRWAVLLSATAFFPLVISMATLGSAWRDVAVGVLVCGLFLTCFRLAAARQFFSARWLTTIGVSSYSLYLLHQDIGVTLSSLISKHWSMPLSLSLSLPILIALAMIVVARTVYLYWETPLNSLIVRRYQRAVLVDVIEIDVNEVEPAQ